MRLQRFLRASLAVFPLAMPLLPAPAAAQLEPLTVSPRNVSYQIDVRLDPAARTLTAKQTVVWRNLQPRPTQELRFHLYWNAWRNNRSTWMREARLRSEKNLLADLTPDDWGRIDVDDVRLAGTSLLASFAVTDPEDHNPDDRTVAVLTLPEPVEPGATLELELDWHAKIPRTFARTGFRGEFFFIAQWFPALGVLEPEGWSCHAFHAATEFFSDFGTYRVAITVPARFVVGATGREVLRTPSADGTVTYRFEQDDVHNFAWTASPDYLVLEQRFEAAGLPAVDLRLLLQPEHRAQAERHFAATRVALESYGRWFGPYPYDHLTIVDPAFRSGAGGMEYPTLFTAGTRLLEPEGGGDPEGVVIHEAGHQFWYGLVANDETEHAWLDEGLNTFSTARAHEAAYGEDRWVERYLAPPGTDLGGFLAWRIDDVRMSRAVYGNRADRFLKSGAERADAQARPTFEYFPGLASRISYDKTALWLATLERHLGWETLQRILATFFERYRFRHPEPADFFAVASEVAGQDLSWFFDQVYNRSVDFDYAIDSVASFPAAVGHLERDGGEVYVPPGEAGSPPLYRTEVVVRRLGAGVFPVEVLLVFDDGSELRRRWDGLERWTLVAEERPVKLAWAAVDPDRVLLLDLHFNNNTRRREPRPELAARKWTSKWLVWLQDLLHTFSFFV